MLAEALGGSTVSAEWVEPRASDADMAPARISQLGVPWIGVPGTVY